MKAKLNLDQEKIKQFFVLHTEKVVFGAVAICFVALCYSAVTRKPYHQRPDDLRQLATAASQTIEQSVPTPEQINIEVKNYAALADTGSAPVNPDPYVLVPFDPAPFESKVRRGEPEFLAVVEPVAVPGYGAVAWNPDGGRVEAMVGALAASNNNGGGMGAGGAMSVATMSDAMRATAKPQGNMGMAMDTEGMAKAMRGTTGAKGREDKKDQRQKEKEAAEAAARAEAEAEAAKARGQLKVNLTAGAEVRGKHWIAVMGLVPLREQELAYRKMFQNATASVGTDEPIYYNFSVERKTKGAEWEELLVDDMLMEEVDKFAAVYPEVIDPRFVDPFLCDPIPPVVMKNHDPRKVSHPKIPLIEEYASREPASAQEVKEDPAEAKSEEEKPAARRSRRGRRGVFENEPASRSRSNRRRAVATLERIDYRQFRFFDYSVEPGQTYQYRVRLVLRNPNYETPPRYLQDPALAEGETRLTDWSEPTAPVFVPPGSELLAGEVNPGSGTKESTVSVLISQFDKEQGVEVSHVTEIERGAFANFPSVEVAVATPQGKPSMESLDFTTDALIVDIEGGDRIEVGRRREKEPGRLLLLSADGQISMRSQLEDALYFERQNSRQQSLSKQASGSKSDDDDDDKDNSPFGNFKKVEKKGSRR